MITLIFLLCLYAWMTMPVLERLCCRVFTLLVAPFLESSILGDFKIKSLAGN